MQHPFNAIIPHHSVDSALDTTASPNLMSGFRIPGSIYSASSSSGVGSGYSSVSGGSRHLEHLADYQKRDFLHTAENQLQSLMNTSPASSNILAHSQPLPQHSQPPVIQHQTQHNPSYSFNSTRDGQPTAGWMTHHDYQNMSFNADLPRKQRSDEATSTSTTDSRTSRNYDLERASRLYQTHEELEPVKRFVNKFVPCLFYYIDLIFRLPTMKPTTLRSESVEANRNMPNQNKTIDLPSSTPIAFKQSQQPNQPTRISNTPATHRMFRQSIGEDLIANPYPPKYPGYHHQPTSSEQQTLQQKSPQSLNVSQNSHVLSSSTYSNTSHRHTLHDDSTASSNHSVYTTPSKAAAFLGTISENLIHSKGFEPAPTHKSRRGIRHNMSDDYPVNKLPANAFHSSTRPSYDSLRRRNSDPSKVTLLDVNRGNDKFQSNTKIDIAGHRFNKATGISKAEKCASCMESDAFVNEGHRCMDCKVLVHTKCIQNGGVKTLQCEAKPSKRLRKNVDKSLAASSPSATTPNSKYSGTREYKDSTDKIISDAKELQLMQEFITQKISKMDNDCEKPSEVDRVFKQSLREFKDNLVAQYSVAHKQNADTLNIKYKDLIANFEYVMETCGGRQDNFPMTMGLNAFRGFLNEFMTSREEKPKTKRKKEKKRKVEEHTSFNGMWFFFIDDVNDHSVIQ